MSVWGRRVPLRQAGRQAYLESGGLRQHGEVWDSAIFKNIWISLISHDSREQQKTDEAPIRCEEAVVNKTKNWGLTQVYYLSLCAVEHITWQIPYSCAPDPPVRKRATSARSSHYSPSPGNIPVATQNRTRKETNFSHHLFQRQQTIPITDSC